MKIYFYVFLLMYLKSDEFCNSTEKVELPSKSLSVCSIWAIHLLFIGNTDSTQSKRIKKKKKNHTSALYTASQRQKVINTQQKEYQWGSRGSEPSTKSRTHLTMLHAEETPALILQHKNRLYYPLKAVWSLRKDKNSKKKRCWTSQP